MRMDEKACRQIAEKYLSEYAALLRRELVELDQLAQMPTPSLDRRVLERVAAIKRARRNRLLGGLVAACLAVALAAPSGWHLYSQGRLTPPYGGQQPSAPTYEILPLSFALPEQFTVASVEQDSEKTVYLLDNRMLDPVVMTMERGGDTAFLGTLTPLTIAGREVYGRAGGGYSLLAFEEEGILYLLTCAHDINTLADLSRGILL